MMKFERVLRGETEDVPAHIYKFCMRPIEHSILMQIVNSLRKTYYVDNIPKDQQDPTKVSSVNMLIVGFISETRDSTYIVISVPQTKYNNGEFLLNLAADIISTVNSQLLAYGEVTS